MKKFLTSLLQGDARTILRTGLLAWLVYLLLKLVLQMNGPGKQPHATTPQTIPAVKMVRDRNDQLNALVQAQEAERERYEGIIDSLSQALLVKPKQVQSHDRYIIRTDTVIVEKVQFTAEVDSVRLYKKDAYLELLAVGKDTGISYIQLAHRDTLFRTEVRRSSLFKAPYTIIYLRNASPYNQVTHGASFSVRTPRPILTLGPYLGYDITDSRFAIGVSIQAPFVTFFSKR